MRNNKKIVDQNPDLTAFNHKMNRFMEVFFIHIVRIVIVVGFLIMTFAILASFGGGPFR